MDLRLDLPMDFPASELRCSPTVDVTVHNMGSPTLWKSLRGATTRNSVGSQIPFAEHPLSGGMTDRIDRELHVNATYIDRQTESGCISASCSVCCICCVYTLY